MTNDERDDMIRATHHAVIIMVEKVKNHDHDLYGNGKDGIKIEVDRLKGFKRFSCWFFSVITIATIGMVFKLLYAFMTTQK